jgi:cold shock CspA family protein
VTAAGPRGRRAHGVVVGFDAAEGLGTIQVDGVGEVPFHATQLDDGTRTIEVGCRVDLTIVPWHRGGLEATEVAVAPTAAR